MSQTDINKQNGIRMPPKRYFNIYTGPKVSVVLFRNN